MEEVCLRTVRVYSVLRILTVIVTIVLDHFWNEEIIPKVV